MTPKDIKYASIYDSFTITVLMQIEDLGFCKKGEGGKFVADGNLISGVGKLPFNTDGGGPLQQSSGQPRRHDQDHRSGAAIARRGASEGAGTELRPRLGPRHRRPSRRSPRRIDLHSGARVMDKHSEIPDAAGQSGNQRRSGTPPSRASC